MYMIGLYKYNSSALREILFYLVNTFYLSFWDADNETTLMPDDTTRLLSSIIWCSSQFNTSQFLFAPSMSASPPVRESVFSFGRRPRSGRGNKELRLHRIIKKAKLSKLSLVTPNSWVRPAPNSPPATLPPLQMDMRVAKRVASIPCGHNLAAKTRTGMNDACTRIRIIIFNHKWTKPTSEFYNKFWVLLSVQNHFNKIYIVLLLLTRLKPATYPLCFRLLSRNIQTWAHNVVQFARVVIFVRVPLLVIQTAVLWVPMPVDSRPTCTHWKASWTTLLFMV